ncbi:hypothetical protein DPMN_051231 [Dreissena polymorpha]|uniref:Uncharacterized protein n=1 Tax=Dreissena polymorpha TaxID=45954 RepID=A0A9D4HQ27_DREPO|nr:hypothetical protein DPMN_051231 [Dreissena polymorpha]
MATINDDARTNNVCESWNCGFRQLVGHTHLSLWKLVECVNKDNPMVEADVHRQGSGQSVTRKHIRRPPSPTNAASTDCAR